MNTSDSMVGSVYVPYAAPLPRKTHLPGLLGCVDIVDAFSPTCRESEQRLVYNTAYSRIRAKGRRIGRLQRLGEGIYG